MVGRRSEQVLVTTVERGARRRRPDEVVVEEPLTIQLDGCTVATTMRTPGHDFELAAGFCLTEGLLAGAAVRHCRYCTAATTTVDGANGSEGEAARYNTVDVDTGGRAPPPVPRIGPTTAACGVCGSASITGLAERLEPLPPAASIPVDVLLRVVEEARGAQELFGRTGAAHAAASFTPRGEVLVVREDIGRHNAVDKVVGAMLLAGALPATGLGLFVSGRASFEMVQKAWAGGFSTVVAVSAPSSLAVATARTAGLTLAGFVRGDRLTLYNDANEAAGRATDAPSLASPS